MSLRQVLKQAYEIAKLKGDHVAMIEVAKMMIQKNIHDLSGETAVAKLAEESK